MPQIHAEIDKYAIYRVSQELVDHIAAHDPGFTRKFILGDLFYIAHADENGVKINNASQTWSFYPIPHDLIVQCVDDSLYGAVFNASRLLRNLLADLFFDLSMVIRGKKGI